MDFNIDLNQELIDETLLGTGEPVVVPANKKVENKQTPENPEEVAEDLIDPNDLVGNIETSGDKKTAAIKATAEFLKSAGAFEDIPDDFEATPEALVGLIDAKAELTARSIIEQREAQLPEPLKDLIDKWDELGEAAFEDILQSKAKQYKYSSITENSLKEDTALQKDLYKQFLKETTKFSDAKINKMIAEAEDDLALEEIVKTEALPELLKLEKENEIKAAQQAKVEKEQAKKNYDKVVQTYKETLDKTEEIAGLKLSKKEKEEIFKYITQPTGKDAQGNPVFYSQAVYAQDPVAYNLAVTALLLKTKGLKDGGALVKSAATVATKELEKKLEKSQLKKRSAPEDHSDEFGDSDISKAFYETFSYLQK